MATETAVALDSNFKLLLMSRILVTVEKVVASCYRAAPSWSPCAARKHPREFDTNNTHKIMFDPLNINSKVLRIDLDCTKIWRQMADRCLIEVELKSLYLGRLLVSWSLNIILSLSNLYLGKLIIRLSLVPYMGYLAKYCWMIFFYINIWIVVVIFI